MKTLLLAAALAVSLPTLAYAQTAPATTTQTKQPQLPPAEPSDAAPSAPLPPGVTRIFDGKTLDGWVQEPPYAASLSVGEISDLAAFLKRVGAKSDPVSAYLNEQLEEPVRMMLALPDKHAQREFRAALGKNLTRIVTGESIYDETRFQGVKLRPETEAFLHARDSQGRELARLNRMLLEDAYPNEIWQSPTVAWGARNGILESLGAGRGVIHTAMSFPGRYRVIFDVRHRGALPGQDHRAGVLVLCTPMTQGEKPVNDALAGIQFQVPFGGSWDYRPGKNNSGKGLFTRVTRPEFNEREWARCEILVDPVAGTARMAVAQPPGAKGVEVLQFKDPTATGKGPFALQMHNRGLFDEFANIAVEENPTGDELEPSAL